VAFETQQPPVGQARAELVAWLDREQQLVKAEFDRVRQVTATVVGLLTVNGVATEWLWSDLLVGDPGAGRVRGDNVNINALTEIVLSMEDGYGRTILGVLPYSGIRVGDFLTMQDTDRAATGYYEVTVAGVVTPGTPDYLTLGVAVVSAGATNPALDDVMVMRWKWTLDTQQGGSL
jgi:hypothetical protein